MSLISDALRKAQRNRSGDGPADTGGGRPMRTGSGPGSQAILIGAGVVVVLVVVAAGAVVWLLRPNEEEIARRVAEARAADTMPAPVAAAPVAEKEAAPQPERAPTAPPPLIELAIPETVAAPPAPGSATRATTSLTPLPSGVSPAAIQAYIDDLSIAGVRSSGNDSRVLMNDKVYRVEDYVNRDFGLVLTEVEPNRLTFRDQAGNEYRRNF